MLSDLEKGGSDLEWIMRALSLRMGEDLIW